MADQSSFRAIRHKNLAAAGLGGAGVDASLTGDMLILRGTGGERLGGSRRADPGDRAVVLLQALSAEKATHAGANGSVLAAQLMDGTTTRR